MKPLSHNLELPNILSYEMTFWFWYNNEDAAHTNRVGRDTGQGIPGTVRIQSWSVEVE